MTKNKFFIYFTFLLGILALIVACDLQKDVNIDLPEYEEELLVEAYLEPGKPYRLTLLETVSYFDFPIPPAIENAEVVITHNGVSDTLRYIDISVLSDTSFFDSFENVEAFLANTFSESELEIILNDLFQADPANGDFGLLGDMLGLTDNKFYNYVSVKRVPMQVYNETFELRINDQEGRTLTGLTHFLEPVPFDSMKYRFDEDSLALFQYNFTDNGNQVNYYRQVVSHLNEKEDSIDFDTGGGSSSFDFIRDDQIVNGESIAFATPFVYEKGDTLVATIYHLTEDFYEYFRSAEDAVQSNGNPFGSPSVLLSNVEGGIGVFGALSYARDTIVIE